MRRNQQLFLLLALGLTSDRILADLDLPAPSSAMPGNIPTNVPVRWQYEADGYVYTSPAIGADGTVYFASVFGMVLAVDGQTGAEKWRYAIQNRGRLASSPALGPDGTVYIGGGDGAVYALDGKTGTKKWSFITSNWYAIYSSPTIGNRGIVYIGAMDDKVYALEAETGRKIWEFKTGGDVWSSATLNREETTIYIGSFDQNVYALDAADGTLRWQFKTEGMVYATGAIDELGVVYISSEDGCVYALDGHTGVKKWVADINAPLWSSPVLTPDHKVIIGDMNNRIIALSRDNGSFQWICSKLAGSICSTPAIDQKGILYVGSEMGKVYAINSTNGALLWQFGTRAPVYSSPAIGDDGTLYIGSDDHYLYALASSGGGLAHSSWAKFKGNCRNSSQITPMTTSASFAAWAQALIPAEALRAPQGDADADGLFNGLEYALGTGPMNSDLGANYGATLASSATDPGALILTHREGKETQGVSFEIQQASQLPPVWTTFEPLTADVSVDDQGTHYIKHVRIPLPPSSTTLFLRVVVKLDETGVNP